MKQTDVGSFLRGFCALSKGAGKDTCVETTPSATVDILRLAFKLRT